MKKINDMFTHNVAIPIVLAILALGLITGVIYAATSSNSSAKTIIVYVGVPQNATATYIQTLHYELFINGTVPKYPNGTIPNGIVGSYNDTIKLKPSVYSQGNFGIVTEFPFQISILNVHVSAGYNAKIALKVPPTPQLLVGSEYTGNYSLPPYFIISPNAPDGNYSSYGINISVERLPTYTYVYGNISFNGPVIQQKTYYSSNESAGASIVKNTYVYDAESGLLLYWTNTTLFLASKNSGVNITSAVYLSNTNINSINPRGNASPQKPPTIPIVSSSTLYSPFLLVLIVVVAVLIILVVILFARRK